jgi:hypothetical protein
VAAATRLPSSILKKYNPFGMTEKSETVNSRE